MVEMGLTVAAPWEHPDQKAQLLQELQGPQSGPIFLPVVLAHIPLSPVHHSLLILPLTTTISPSRETKFIYPATLLLSFLVFKNSLSISSFVKMVCFWILANHNPLYIYIYISFLYNTSYGMMKLGIFCV